MNVVLMEFLDALIQENLEAIRRCPKSDLHNHFVLAIRRCPKSDLHNHFVLDNM